MRLIGKIRKRRELATGVYYKPNMSNLQGKVGKSIIETIKNTPPAQKDDTRRKVEEYKNNILRIRNENESYKQ